MTRFALYLAVAFGLVAFSGAEAQPSGDNYPARPVKLVVGYVPGGSPDTVARVISQRLGQILGQPVVVENRVGAGGTLATCCWARPDNS
jgi:tripartite-type tricarboxylate transporter receptor subunit TctC